MRKHVFVCLFAGLLVTSQTICAQVRVSKGSGAKTTIDTHSFATQGSSSASTFKSVLDADLELSGWFDLAPRGQGAFTLTGSAKSGGGGLEATCQLYDRAGGRSYMNRKFHSNEKDARRLAHKVADEIIFSVTGRKGFLSSRVVMVGNRSGKKELYLCDADGKGIIQLTRDGSVSVGPKWGPDAEKIVYTAYLKKFPDVYMIDLTSNKRKRIANYGGLNTGAAISPNGRYVALILSKDGNPDLYVKNLKNDKLTRLTHTSRAAEASPSWSPDGKEIVYVSDSSGSPQLYIVSHRGGKPARLTSRGSQNVAPDWGENNLITYASLVGGRFQVCVIDPESRELKQITPGDVDYEDPSWAPDGRHIYCGRSRRYRSEIYLLDTMGDTPIALVREDGDWYAPSCSPK